ncbi:MAG TPA: aminopeptidase N [Candidatus Yaniella excrementavium]|nr:aminopeptidase N [Candidatus Yaniella excrementavium]
MSNTALLDDARLTREEARNRSELIEIASYHLELDLRDAMDLEQATFPVTTTLHFTSTIVGAETFLNYLGDTVESIVLNGEELDADLVAGSARILLPDLGAENTVVIRSQSFFSRSGEGLHRFVDPVDGQVYLYSQFEPADARRVYPNMEQPDLKAAFHVTMIGPDTWTIASNGVETDREQLAEGIVRVGFAPTKPTSTYLTTFLAGPYAEFVDVWNGHEQTGAESIDLRIFTRQSLVDHVDAAALFEQTQRGLTWFHEQFQVAYPWGKYDQAFVPEYNLGAMENPGLVTFNEAYIFTSRATISQYTGRATTIMHEMCHMWFGNLVTMKWWDDLWLKESFADFFGSKAVADATELPGAWQSFAHQRKAWAYLQDSYPTTHPIVADIVDLEAARQNFDGITYAKGAAVIKQLFHYVGECAFLQACRTYFERFAFGSAELVDFLKILEEVSNKDMREWSSAWLETSGPTTLRPILEPPGRVTVRQESTDPVTGKTVLRPHHLFVSVFTLDDDEQLVSTDESEVVLPGGESSVVIENLMLPTDRPRVILVNHHDQTYAQVTFDQASLEAVTAYPIVDPNSTAIATVWSTLWTMVRNATLPAATFVRAAAKLSNSIDDVSMHAKVLQQAVTAIQEFAPEGQRKRLTKILSTALLDSLIQLDAGSDRQRSVARALAVLSHDTDALAAEITFLLAGDETSELSPGLQIDDEMKWLLLISMASLERIDITRLDDELAAAPTATNELNYRTAVAALPDQARRTALWMQIYNGVDTEGTPLSNAQITATAQGLSTSQPRFLAQHLQTLLEGLMFIWNSRSNNLATRTINGLFPLNHKPIKGGPVVQENHPVVVNVDAWLGQYPDAPAALQRIVRERRADVVNRLVAQATKF